MNYYRSTIVLSFILLSVACGRKPPNPTSPAAEPAAKEEATPGDEAEPAAGPSEKAAPSAMPPPLEPEAEAAEEAPRLNDDLLSEKKEKSAQLSGPNDQSAMQKARLGLMDALAPERLSCQGAVPFLEAICQIARRLCDSDHPSLSAKKDCSIAKADCQRARTEYAERCNSD